MQFFSNLLDEFWNFLFIFRFTTSVSVKFVNFKKIRCIDHEQLSFSVFGMQKEKICIFQKDAHFFEAYPRNEITLMASHREHRLEGLIGLRVNQIYDIDHKTYLIKLQKPDHKSVLLLESAARVHTTEYEWPKSPAPSGFSMKLRKHLRNKRLECISQLGVDRIVDLTFGSGEAAHHLIIELYDRGNIVLTDGEYTILNVLRPRKEGDDTRITVNQKYPVDNVRKARAPPSIEELRAAYEGAKENVPLKKILNPLLDCGGGILDHELLISGISSGVKKKKDLEINLEEVLDAARRAQLSVINERIEHEKKGYIIKKIVTRVKEDGSSEDAHLFEEFHPQLYIQHKDLPNEEFPSFNKACDEFFSKLEANEFDKKVVLKEKEVLKKLENVRKDHEKRIFELKGKQEEDRKKGQLIELNKQLVEGALLVVRSAIANQIDWKRIEELLEEAQSRKDPVACAVRNLKLQANTITLWLSDPYDFDENDMLLDSDEEREEGTESEKMRPMAIDINLDLSALANARRYYTMKRQAAEKEQKTIDASYKAIRSAEKKTHQTLKEINIIANINKARKVHWFEKFLWFISSENYLVIGGRDSQQNEQVVKRHLKPKDIYVHADLHGAASVIIKNPTGNDVPPRTLHEAGVMALCYSRAWDEKVVTSAWWVWGHQVSKTAPAGEYLTTGAFMVRGKKNFLPPSHLVYGFGFLFRLEESSIPRHENERRVRFLDVEVSSAITEVLDELSADTAREIEVEIPEEEDGQKLETSNDTNDKDQNTGEKDLKEETSSEEDRLDGDEADNSDDPASEGNTPQFPDMELQMSHLTGDQFTLKPKITSVLRKEVGTKEKKSDELVFLGDSEPVIVSRQVKPTKTEGSANRSKTKKEPQEKTKEETFCPESSMKRGKKGKLKKMKKYKDQDEEERKLIMEILQSAGSKKTKGKKKKGETGKKSQEKIPGRGAAPSAQTVQINKESSQSVVKIPIVEAKEQNQDENEEEMMQVPDDLSILNALTALPVPEDELLYAVPVCAPYISMAHFKFKIKLTPGSGKKGKASKTALSLFLSDKSSSNREKDLLKAVKDHDLAKNMPGKVKVSAPNISKIRKN